MQKPGLQAPSSPSHRQRDGGDGEAMLPSWRGLGPRGSRSAHRSEASSAPCAAAAPGAPQNQRRHGAGGTGQSPSSAGAAGDLSHRHAVKPRLGPSTVPGTGFRQVGPHGSQMGLSLAPAPASWPSSGRQRHSGACQAGAGLSLPLDLLGKAPLCENNTGASDRLLRNSREENCTLRCCN